MAKLRRFLRFDLRLTIEEREGYFAALTEPFAITTYGDTEQEAEKRALHAISLLLKRHCETPAECSKYLNRFNVKHLLGTEAEIKQRHPVVRESKQEVRLEVPAGV